MLIALTLALTLGQEPARPSFAEWLAAVRAEAISRGVREEIADAALAEVVEPLPIILERDRSQAETVLPLERYIARSLTPKLVLAGRDAFARHRGLLDQVAERYGVPPRVIVAVWGMESNFGRFSGVRPTVPALATLAWDPRRAAFFRGELFDALEILNRGDIDLPRLKGSWAGAMGQTQFMPSSYLKFAEDFDGDGRRDIWSTPADVFASIANYLKGHGWAADQGWGREVKVTPDAARRIARDVAPRSGTCQATRTMSVALPLARWQELGVRLPGGKALPRTDAPASLVSGATRRFLVDANYDALLEYNCAHSYAITVALLGDAIASDAPPATLGGGQAGAQAETKGLSPEAFMAVTGELDEKGVVVACGACGRKNRLAFGRLGDAVNCGQCKQPIGAPDEPIEIHAAGDFDRLVSSSSLPVVVDYWAPWCGPCRMVAPELKKVAARQAGRVLVVKVNTDELPDLGQRFGIRSIPTLAIFAGGREVARETGARPANEIEMFIARTGGAGPA